MTAAPLAAATREPGSNAPLRTLAVLSLGLLVLWVAFWEWFALSVVISEGTLAWQPWTFILGLLVLGLAAWRMPVAGGVLLIAAACWAAVYFENSGARLLLALPAAAIGVLRIVAGGLRANLRRAHKPG